jgi:hypothetical protein
MQYPLLDGYKEAVSSTVLNLMLLFSFIVYFYLFESRDSAVGVVTGYGLDD